MRRTLLLLSLCLSACGPGAEAENETGVTIPLPPAVPAAATAPEPKQEPAAEPEAPENKAAADEEADEPSATAAEKAKPAPKAKAAEKQEPERDEPETQPKRPESAGDRPPLSDALIASTIRRIGYPCPEVRSTRAVAGSGQAPAGYRISCSSGEIYLGTVVNGRMRFRKSASEDR